MGIQYWTSPVRISFETNNKNLSGIEQKNGTAKSADIQSTIKLGYLNLNADLALQQWVSEFFALWCVQRGVEHG